MDQDASHLDDDKELVAKAMRSEAKAGLQPSFYVRKTDSQVLQGNQLAHITAHKVQTQGEMKDYCEVKSKAKASVPTSTQDSQPSDKARKDKKKKQHKAKRDFTPANGVNKMEVSDHGKKKKDVSEITFYNCNRKGHYLNKCPKPQKSKN